MSFKPSVMVKQTKGEKRPSIYFFETADTSGLVDRVHAVAAKNGISVSRFIREALVYALDNMDE